MRSVLFNAYYWVLSIFYGLSAAFAALAVWACLGGPR